MGQGQSHNLFEAAASDELERAKYFIEHDKTDVNATDKVHMKDLRHALLAYARRPAVGLDVHRQSAHCQLSDA